MARKRSATIAEYIRAAPREGQPHLPRLFAILKSIAAALEPFGKELEKHQTTKNTLQIPYNKALPENLVRKIAEYRLRNMGDSDAFW
jgi:hypothetical protein